MLGSAAAPITGLIFVGLSIYLRTISATSVLRERARFLIVGVMSIVVFAALGLVPQGRKALGLENLGLALALALAVARLLMNAWSSVAHDVRIRFVVVALATAASGYAGVSLLVGHGGGLYVALPAALAGIANNVGGAWSLLMSTEEREAAEIGG
jgi:hypothetical protein